jgi:hypothetical protein
LLPEVDGCKIGKAAAHTGWRKIAGSRRVGNWSARRAAESERRGYAVMPIFIDCAAASHCDLSRETDIASYSRKTENIFRAEGFSKGLSRQRP